MNNSIFTWENKEQPFTRVDHDPFETDCLHETSTTIYFTEDFPYIGCTACGRFLSHCDDNGVPVND